jgi:hypothetical protein
MNYKGAVIINAGGGLQRYLEGHQKFINHISLWGEGYQKYQRRIGGGTKNNVE